jgi:hypothetical protein
VRYVSTVPKAAFAAALVALVVGGCAGTEQPIFESVIATVDPPAAGPPVVPADSGAPGPMLPMPPVHHPPDDEDAGPKPDPGLDPTAEFPWTQTLPGVGTGTCRSGRYAGAFDCIMIGELTGWPLSITGEIAFTLTGSAEQQILKVEEGSLAGLFFSAETISGQLDCTQDEFDAYSNDGVVVNPIFPDTFSSFLTGTSDDQSLSIEGPFTMLNEEGEQCEGTFSVSIAP